jgi:SAM-dependent methyltransferase
VTGGVERQRRFYETREHAHLQPRADDFYAAKLVRTLARATGMGGRDRVLEVGAGFGRFTFELLDHCGSVVALDLAPRALAQLDAERDARDIDASRCRTHCADLAALEPGSLGERFPFVVGFFLLHHLPDVPDALRRLAGVLAPGGVAAFVEPNRRNPLFLAQVACTPDMTWAEERGMFRLSARGVQDAFAGAGLAPSPVERFGFFPPQVVNNVAAGRRLETWLERRRALAPILPFLLLRARAPAQ